MSGFFGVFSPVVKLDHGAFDKMKATMIRDGYDGLTTWSNDKIAFGHLMLRASPESKFDQQPIESECGRFVIVGHFRLDYRDELADKLGIVQAELEKIPDSFLVLRSYVKWGNRCANHLEGDWAFVLYDNHNHSIFIARDKIGYSALFHCKIGRNFYFSSDLDVLVAGLNQVEVDKVQLYLMSLGRNYITKGKTLFKGVSFLHPSSSIEIDKHLNYVTARTNFLKNTSKLNFKFERDYFLEFKSSFQIALKNKILGKGDFGILLSGGYDSFLVAKSADLQFRQTEQKLYSFTRSPIEVDSRHDVVADIDEFEVVRQFQKDFAKTIFHSSSYQDINSNQYLSQVEDLNSFNPIVTANSYWINGIIQNVNISGCKNLLIGQFGNYSLSWDAPKIILADSFLSLVKSYIKIVITRSFREKSILNSKNFLSFKQMISVVLALLKQQIFFINSKSLRHYLISQNCFDLGARHFVRGDRFSLILIDPTADERFLKISFSIPELLFNKFSQKKYLYHKAFVDIVGESFFSITTSNIHQSRNFRFKLAKDTNILPDVVKLISSFITNNYFRAEFISKHINSSKGYIVLDCKTDLEANEFLKSMSILDFCNKKSNFIL